MKLNRIPAILAVCSLAACSYSQEAATDDFDSVMAAAVAELDRAKAAGNEWRDSRMILSRAQAAYDKGDIEQAIALANKARMQGESAVAQANSQQDAASRY